jgi:hypothetical protein
MWGGHKGGGSSSSSNSSSIQQVVFDMQTSYGMYHMHHSIQVSICRRKRRVC